MDMDMDMDIDDVCFPIRCHFERYSGYCRYCPYHCFSSTIRAVGTTLLLSPVLYFYVFLINKLVYKKKKKKTARKSEFEMHAPLLVGSGSTF